MTRALLFDFDGIILDTEVPIFAAWQDLYQEHGQTLELPDYLNCIGSDFGTWSPKTHLENLIGQTLDWNALDTRRQAQIDDAVQQLQPMSGIREILTSASAHGLRLAVVSSSGHHWVDSHLERLGLLPTFETVICREDAPRLKPAPDLYLEARRRLSLPPEDCLVIEDSRNGLQAALAADLPIALIRNRLTAQVDATSATHTLESAWDLFALLDLPQPSLS